MKLKTSTAHELISNMRSFFEVSDPIVNYAKEEPLRSELFSSDEMKQYAKELASTHKLARKQVKGRLLDRLTDNERVLDAVRKLLVEAIKANGYISPAGEWLIDNFYLIEEQIRTAKRHLPRQYNEKLPQLEVSDVPGKARVYDIALRIISHSDGRIDPERLSGFIGSYQSVSQLQLGELWAIPIMLRLTLIENLRRVSSLIAIDKVDKNLADYWAKKMLKISEDDSQSLMLIVGDMARSAPPMVSAFVAEISRQLLGKGPALALSLTWIEQKLNEDGRTINELVSAEIQKQAANQVSVSNSIGSLRLLSSIDWRDFVEEHSVVEQTLSHDYDGIYSGMDFQTRDNYRHVVERIAKRSRLPENEVAKIAVQLAAESKLQNGSDSRKAHVGYYLIGTGLGQTKKKAGIRDNYVEAMREALIRNRLVIYLGSVLFITIALSAVFLLKSYAEELSTGWLIVIGLLLTVASSQLAVTVVNFFSTLLVKPHLLPRMDFSLAIPDQYSTLIVIPSMLTSNVATEELIESLEVRFLANRDKNLFFCLLTDFTDGAKESLPEDEQLLALVKKRIEALKRKYEKGQRNIFFLLHRPRQWNEVEKIWMAYERKRGKLAELNALLRGSKGGGFSCIVGDSSALQQIKYVITLDTDTQLPRNSARKMVATMAHPLNHAFYNEQKQRVTDGYGLLQPRVSVSLPESNSSVYSRLHGNEPGIDPYTRATSDVYQDVFKEGSFIGKGIYDVDIFEKALKGRFLENRILSHDLLEGCYVRSGLISDIEILEKYPMTYHKDMKRRSRWIRGDWQIFLWFLPFVPGADSRLQKNPISALSCWKIFDNIRRSLVPIALTLLVVLGWCLLKDPFFWTIAVSGIITLPVFITLIWDAFRKPDDVILFHHFNILIRSAGNIIVQTLFSLICLPYEAFANAVAIIRTNWRMVVSHRHLLEWEASGNAGTGQTGLAASYSEMWISPFLSFAILIYLFIYFPGILIIAGPILFLWACAPYITWRAGEPPVKKKAVLSHEQNIFLHKIARKTWGFFEQFAGAEENWLPPDNYQQHPTPVIAHHTSPTNIGLALLSNLSAHDFGYISTSHFLERTAGTINSMQKLERYRGHFYNWYNTLSLQPLSPKYISTVDSGNLSGHLLTLRQGIFEIIHKTIARSAIFNGLLDTMRALYDTMDKESVEHLTDLTGLLELYCAKRPLSLTSINASLKRLKEIYESVTGRTEVADNTMTAWWLSTFSKQLQGEIDDLQIFAPWFLMPVPLKFVAIVGIDDDITLGHLYKKTEELIPLVAALKIDNTTPEETEWLDAFNACLIITQNMAKERIALVNQLGHDCIALADKEWKFLYDGSKHLFTIGFRVEEHTCDPSYYDLLASEARMATFVAIAKGELPEESWFALGRQLTNAGQGPILLSWGGSMFEYLMPLLVMPTYENTLLDQTYKTTVSRQIEYGKQRGTPWGVSESGYNMVDACANYQYRSFGVPGLGLKRGLEADLVIAPYATALSLMVAPELSCQNLEVLSGHGFEGAFGFYEAIDYTPSRLQRGQDNAIIRSFMAHHQGMSLLSLGYLLHGQPMQRRFESEPQFQATLLLLQERIPKASSFFTHTSNMADTNIPNNGPVVRIIDTPDTLMPEIQLLSNGKYHVMISNSGGGYSRWKDFAVTRWREDGTCDNWGTFCYIRDMDSGEFWSTTHQPSLKKGQSYEAAFSQGRADFHTSNNNIDTHTEIAVSPEDDVEIRRMHITNNSSARKTIEITSYAEVVIASPASDAMQPAFSNLFVQTEILPLQRAIICSRRPGADTEHFPVMFHSMIIHGKDNAEAWYETDRMEFVGYGNTPANPDAMANQGPLSGKQGSVLDPIVAIRYKVILEAEENIIIDLIIGVGDTRKVCDGLIVKYQDKHHKSRFFELAWTHSQVILRQINATNVDERLFNRLAGSIIFSNRSLRASPSVVIKNHKGQSGLWGYSISGDLPIVLVQIEDQQNIDLAKQLIQAHNYWKLKGLAVDLVIWNENRGDYRQALQDQIKSFVPNELLDKPGGVFVRDTEQISEDDRILFQTVARVNISDANGTLADHVNRKPYEKSLIPYIKRPLSYIPQSTSELSSVNLIFFNGSGGFSPDGKEYVINIDHKNRTPAPWVNVIANPDFGTVLTENGQAYTWCENAHEMRLTPWNNDIVSGSGGEVFYLRDEEAGHFWSASHLPCGGHSTYITRHGFGYSIFEHTEDGIHSEMAVFVDIACPIKFTILKVRNHSGRARRLSVTGYTEWVLGDLRPKTAMHIITEIDPVTGALFARNPYNTEFATKVAFFDVGETTENFTGDRNEFIGRNGSLRDPDAMHRLKLSGKAGVALDPCAAIQVPFELADGEEREVIFRLGAGNDSKDAGDILNRFRSNDAVHAALQNVSDHWQKTTTALVIETPDIALNTIANGWLTYQTLSCRLWGRSGFYQSGGAFGFRDQLQDVLSLLHAEPKLARKQILLCATRQFLEGDVQHWWHPPSGRGVRTRISDDFLWLPFVTARYVVYTGDVGILDEPLHFLQGRPLNSGEESYYELPERSEQSSTLYDHCMRAVKHGLSFGKHGLPLMGTGDWNDGMNRVGHNGKGESIWLGFFLYDVLTKFTEVAIIHKDPVFAAQCKKDANALSENIEKNGWDGAWYRRAYFDDGTPLGSASNTECKIDAIAQSWSALSGAGERQRSVTAMEAAFSHLVDKAAAVIQLLDPPFDKAAIDPGYIKGYVPGVRENGGQYTHAAVWTVMAFAKLGNRQRTWELLKMINPLNHGNTPEGIAVYKVEPYVMAGDVYALPPHTGHGGWTWYTGAASWMYQLITESFLGLQTEGDQLTFTPCIPVDWRSFKVHYRYRDTMYNISFLQNNMAGNTTVSVDGISQEANAVYLIDDKVAHDVEVLIFTDSINENTDAKHLNQT